MTIPLLLLLSSYALADPSPEVAVNGPETSGDPAGKVCDPDNPDRCSQPILEGQVAPFAGQLVSTELAIALAQKATHCDARLDIETRRLAKEAQVDLELAEKQREIQTEGLRHQLQVTRKRLELAEDRPFFERPGVVMVSTIIITSAVLVGMWWASVETMKALDPSPAQ